MNTSRAATSLLFLALSVPSPDAAAENDPPGRSPGDFPGQGRIDIHTRAPVAEESGRSDQYVDVAEFAIDREQFAGFLSLGLSEGADSKITVDPDSMKFSRALLNNLFANVLTWANPRRIFRVRFEGTDAKGQPFEAACGVTQKGRCLVRIDSCSPFGKDFGNRSVTSDDHDITVENRFYAFNSTCGMAGVYAHPKNHGPYTHTHSNEEDGNSDYNVRVNDDGRRGDGLDVLREGYGGGGSGGTQDAGR